MKNFLTNLIESTPHVAIELLNLCLDKYPSADTDLMIDVQKLITEGFAEPATKEQVEILRQLMQIRRQNTIKELLTIGVSLGTICDLICLGIQEQVCGASSWLLSLYETDPLSVPLYSISEINDHLARAFSSRPSSLLPFLFEDLEEVNPESNIFKYFADVANCPDEIAIRDLAYYLDTDLVAKILVRQFQEMDAFSLDCVMENLFGHLYDCPKKLPEHDVSTSRRLAKKADVFKRLFATYGDIIRSNLSQRSPEEVAFILSSFDRDSAISYLKEQDPETREMLLRLLREDTHYALFEFEKVFPEA